MRTNKHKLIEQLISLIAGIDFSKIKDDETKRDKDLLLKYINKEFFDLNEFRHLLSTLDLKRSNIIEILYLLLLSLEKEKTNKNILSETTKLIKYATKYGFTWESSNDCFQKIEEEFIELKKAVKNNDNNNIKEELGDLIFTLQCYATMKEYDIKQIINDANFKFEKRFKKLRKIAELEGIDIKNASSKVKDKLWQKVKKYT